MLLGTCIHYKKYGRTGLWTNRYMAELVYGRIVSKANSYVDLTILWQMFLTVGLGTRTHVGPEVNNFSPTSNTQIIWREIILETFDTWIFKHLPINYITEIKWYENNTENAILIVLLPHMIKLIRRILFVL